MRATCSAVNDKINSIMYRHILVDVNESNDTHILIRDAYHLKPLLYLHRYSTHYPFEFTLGIALERLKKYTRVVDYNGVTPADQTWPLADALGVVTASAHAPFPDGLTKQFVLPPHSQMTLVIGIHHDRAFHGGFDIITVAMDTRGLAPKPHKVDDTIIIAIQIPGPASGRHDQFLPHLLDLLDIASDERRSIPDRCTLIGLDAPNRKAAFASVHRLVTTFRRTLATMWPEGFEAERPVVNVFPLPLAEFHAKACLTDLPLHIFTTPPGTCMPRPRVWTL